MTCVAVRLATAALCNHSACLPIAGSIAGVAKCRVVITATVSTSQGGQDRASAASASQGLHKVDLLVQPRIHAWLLKTLSCITQRVPACVMTAAQKSEQVLFISYIVGEIP